MTTNTSPKTPILDGLLTCAECGRPMTVDESPEPAVHLPTYADQRLAPVPNAGAAHRTDRRT